MKLRFDPILQLNRNQITPMEDSYFVFIDEEGHDLPIGVFFPPSPIMVEEGHCPPGHILRLYTAAKQAFGFYGSYQFQGLEGMEAVEELFDGTYEDVGNRLFPSFQQSALEQWRSYKEGTTDEFVIEPKGKGYCSYFGFLLNSATPRALGRINHKRGRKYSISLFGFDSLTLPEEFSLKEVRAVARSLANQDTFVDVLAKANLDCVLEYLRNVTRSAV
ncbi:MAG: hypothetical protein VXZ72_02270 [Chlamydiota bacterium]|nr:hypothetical protein [Chlamydiota bacterium]